jgi:hypothetical protein
MLVRVKHGSLQHQRRAYLVGETLELDAELVQHIDPHGVTLERLAVPNVAPVLPSPAPAVEAPAIPSTDAPKRRRKDSAP